MCTTLDQRDIVVVLVPVTSKRSKRFWIDTLPVGLWLPLDVCPSVVVLLAVPAGAEVVAQPRVATTQRPVMRPGGILYRRHGQILVAIVKTSPVRPAGSALSIFNVVHFVGADGYVDIRAFVLEDVLHAAPLRSIFAIFGPDESLVGFDAADLLAVLNPGSMVMTIFFDIAPVRHGRLVEDWEVIGHGRGHWNEG